MNHHSFDRYPLEEPHRESDGGWEAPVPRRSQFASSAVSRNALPKSRLELERFNDRRPAAASTHAERPVASESRAARTRVERAAMFRRLLAELAEEEDDARREDFDRPSSPYRPFRLEDRDRETLQSWNSRLVSNRPLGDEGRNARPAYDDADFDALLDELR